MTNFARSLGYYDHEAHALFSVIAGIALMVYLMEATDWLRTQLSNQPYLVLLGKLSFSLYLTHIPILFTFTCRVFLWLYSFHENMALASVGALLLSLPVMLGAAMVFWTFVDEPSIRWSKEIARHMLGPGPRSSSEASVVNSAETANSNEPIPIAPNLEASETSEGSLSSLS